MSNVCFKTMKCFSQKTCFDLVYKMSGMVDISRAPFYLFRKHKKNTLDHENKVETKGLLEFYGHDCDVDKMMTMLKRQEERIMKYTWFPKLAI